MVSPGSGATTVGCHSPAAVWAGKLLFNIVLIYALMAILVPGILAFVFGAILMFDSGVPGFQISITFVISLAIASALFLAWVMTYLMKLRKRGAVYGRESIVGSTGVATEDFVGEGRIWLEGEAWTAHASVPIEGGRAKVR